MSEEEKNIDQEQEESLDEGYYIEAIDRAYIVQGFIETTLLEHSVIQKHLELKEKVEQAQELIIHVYQLIGGLTVRLFTPEDKLPEFLKKKK